MKLHPPMFFPPIDLINILFSYLRVHVKTVARNPDKMSILKYFKPVGKKEKDFALPDPSGPLSKLVPSLSIEAANKKVSKLIVNPLESSSK